MKAKTLFRRSWCRWFHRRHIKPTPPFYALATGITGYCDKCYEFIYCDEMGKPVTGTKAQAHS